MTVYVDDMHTTPMGQFKTPSGRVYKMCHMVADTTAELLTMADQIGVARRWLQKAGSHHEHFDIAMSKRALAVQLGAVEITMSQLGRIVRAKRTDIGSTQAETTAGPSSP